LASPKKRFVAERCIVESCDSGCGVFVDDLFREWTWWASANNVHIGSKEWFGRDMRAAVPSIELHRESAEPRRYYYWGIKLKPFR
jgi:hypothetical protein